jgi:hypothetical protein
VINVNVTRPSPIRSEPVCVATAPHRREDSPHPPPAVAPEPAFVSAFESQPCPRSRTRRFGRWLNRPRRVLLTLAAIWVVAIFDLGYTIAESSTLDFQEMNPVAAHLLRGPPTAIIAYKFGLLGLGTTILLVLRRKLIAELACWLLFAFKIYLAARWYLYFDSLLQVSGDQLLYLSQ